MKRVLFPAIALLLLSGCEKGVKIPKDAIRIEADAQTEAIMVNDDVADDPAIWVNAADPAKSLIIGTHKKGGGLEVYDLSGKRLQSLPEGKFNNVDLRYGFQIGEEKADIVAATKRDDDTIALYKVDALGPKLVNVNARALPSLPESYGLCMYHDRAADKQYVFVNNKNGTVAQIELFAAAGKVDGKEVRRFEVGSQTEGCVADDETDALYVGEEDKGIWRYNAKTNGGNDRVLIDHTGKEGHLVADVEGLALYTLEGGKGYLIASSQGNHTYTVYDRQSGAYLGRFTLVDGAIDGVQETDGIEVLSAGLGEKYPRGLMVVQDGELPGGGQNFKLIDFGKALDGLKLPH